MEGWTHNENPVARHIEVSDVSNGLVARGFLSFPVILGLTPRKQRTNGPDLSELSSQGHEHFDYAHLSDQVDK